MFFHSRAHRVAISLAGIESGMNVLEVATGSGEMFRRILRANPGGITCGIDISPNMAARTQRIANRRIPGSRAHCQAVDARSMPFRDGSFDAVVCCYLLELLGEDDIVRTLSEMRRVLRPHGKLSLVLIGQQLPAFNAWYRLISSMAPAFLGRQAASIVPDLMEDCDFRIDHDLNLRQGCYPSRVIVARK
ncbi:MAG: class I SAM-dependent methyltransferase [Acidobacteriota bacterium]|nr:class I SAM-dependent methyltransferase [Acidobacteriota bacterium]